MFENARLKLTAWYLLIIMLICFLFSLVIFRVADRELERIDRRQQALRERFGVEIFRPQFPEGFNVPIDVDDLRGRIILTLIFINSAILIIAGMSGYFLAGQTLTPIKVMVEEQNRFISDASHELRTPITSLKSAMEVHLRDKKLTLPQAKKLIVQNLNDVNRIQSLSDALLKLAQYQKPNSHTVFEKVSLAEIIKTAMLTISPLAKRKQISLKSKISDYHLTGSREGLIDLMVIILDNAVKYTHPKKSITVSSAKTDGNIFIKVEDNGIGIDKKDLPHVFDRFYQATDARSKSTTGGYGLGLSIAKRIVTIHHGSITVLSQKGKGSVFTVHLPLKHSKIENS
ncbi:hypothetical protein A2W14_03090 [Candidatus Gottesmanbacteria bacterium RBG_16_37_8]|uniref:histidine kinase n=1 Tax=Candidatus Gottesmanbacteria bacterium RBG_16_37_8 TaxID=1798371 RepID=A0A1F5YTW8_9BACT|nr:MAG: hypothetical protein A2W14_03090 [Candidatus Gottesmanbacteria bacterium RBG_16_37_8]